MVADQVRLFLDNPILLPDAFAATESVEVIKGDNGNATVLGVLEVRNDINWALYTSETVLELQLIITDELGNDSVIELGDVFLYGPEPGGSLPDVEVPMLVEATVNGGETIVVPDDLEEDEFDFTGTMRLTDVWKGVEGASLTYLHEDGGFLNSLSLDVEVSDLSSGTLTDGTYTATSSAGKYIKSGTYELFGFSVEDKAGNELANFGSSAPAGVQATVEVVNPNEDPAPPELTSPVLVAPISGDVTAGPLSLTFSFSAQDEDSGITFGTITVFHSTDEEVTPVSTFLSPANLVSGDEFMGSYEVTVEIPQGQAAGDYFYQVRLTDGSFQSVTYGKSRPGFDFTIEPLPDGSTEMVTIANSGSTSLDTTPPVLDSITVDFDANLAEGPGVMTVTMMISEPDSALSNFGNFVRFISPSGATDISQSFGLFNQDPETGAYVITINLDKAIETGTYCFAVHLENTDGFESDYGQNYDFLPFPGDFPGTWEISHEGPIDYTPPILTEFTVTPGVVESGTDVTLSVTLRIQDEGTGIQFTNGFQFTNLDLLNGLPGDFNFRQSIFNTQLQDPEIDERGEGTLFDVTYTFDIPLTGDMFGGDFLSFRLNVMDCAGNSRIYESSICNVTGSYPFPYDYVQITTNGNEDPIIWSNGGGDTASALVEEGQTAVTTVRAFDTPGDILTFSISGGADAALFDLNSVTGVLTFKTAPSFASPGDSGADGTYDVTVEVADGNGGLDSQAIAVTVTEIASSNSDPSITSNGGGNTALITLEEGNTAVTTVTATDPDLPEDTLTLSLSGGADVALFGLNAETGALTFLTAPAFDPPGDANGDNVYEVTVQVADAESATDTQNIAVTITETPGNRDPSITSNGGGDTAQINVEQGTTAVTTVTVTDPDLPSDTLTLSISGGADSALFGLNAETGVLAFLATPAFDPPGDANGDNVYEVTVQVADAEGALDTQEISVNLLPDVIDENEYEDYANGSSSPFPSTATTEEKAFDFDYDGDGISNGDEFLAGTDPTNAGDFFWAILSYQGGADAKVIFWPYSPDTHVYALYEVFQGSENNEQTDTGIAAEAYEGDSTMGCFELSVEGGAIETFLTVGAVRTSL